MFIRNFMSFFKHPIGRRIPSILSSIAGPVTRQGNCKLYRITIAPPPENQELVSSVED